MSRKDLYIEKNLNQHEIGASASYTVALMGVATL